MERPERRCHVLLGSVAEHLAILQRVARRTGSLPDWTVNSSALPGDLAAFYLRRPLSSFIALGEIADEPKKNTDRRDYWFGYYMAPIDRVTLLPRFVHLREVKRALPRWGYLKQPRRSAKVPASYVAHLLSTLRAPTPRRPDPSRSAGLTRALEGMLREETRFTSGRSRRLRQIVLDRAKGMCQACRVDYSLLLNGLGQRVLQVHHRKQLGINDTPRVTRDRDLAVLCANCHALVHADPEHALEVEALQRLLLRHPRRGGT